MTYKPPRPVSYTHLADEAHEGLQQQVAQLGEIDARAINTIDIGDGLHVRVGRYGPYLEDMEHLDAEGNPKRASLPDTIAPDELTVAVALSLIHISSDCIRGSLVVCVLLTTG